MLEEYCNIVVQLLQWATIKHLSSDLNNETSENTAHMWQKKKLYPHEHFQIVCQSINIHSGREVRGKKHWLFILTNEGEDY